MTQLPVPVAPAADVGHELVVHTPAFSAALDSAKAYAGASKADRTVRAYRGAFDDFRTWCGDVGADALPASVETTASYMASLADRGCKPSTIDLHAAAIAYAHRAAGFEPPTNSEPVKAVSLAFRPLGDGITDLKAQLVKMEARADRYVPREDLEHRFANARADVDARFAVVTQRRDDLQRLTDARVDRVERDLDAIQKHVVPRGEHEQMWAAQRARDADLQRQADQARQGLYDLNTPRDTMQRMQRQIEQLERDQRRPGG